MKEVVQKEVVKLLDVNIIHLIFDSQWDNSVLVVPKKSDITMVQNNDGELVPTR